MRTPSLTRRVVVAGVVVLVVVLAVLDVAVYLAVRAELETNLSEVLDTRLDIARGLADDVAPAALAERLTAMGVPASLTLPDGRHIDADPAVPRFGRSGIPSTLPEPRVERHQVVDGLTITVYATRSGVDQALRRLLLVQVLGTLVAVGVAVLLLRRSTTVALGPLDHVVATAVRTSHGARGERLHPDRPETELGRLAVAFDQMLDELEAAVVDARASDARSQRFLADAAHQLRTPIAGIRASVESLLREDDPGVRDRLMGNVVRETGRSARLVSDLLHVARLDRGEDLPVRERLDLLALCEGEVLRARDLAPHLDVVLDPGLVTGEVEVLADGTAIREAVGNLLDNARRHARQWIEVGVATSADDVAVVVRDDGPGLSPAEADGAFERFVSLDGRGGSGLGLPIARGVAVAHGGDLLHSDGAFTLRLPRHGDRSPTAGR